MRVLQFFSDRHRETTADVFVEEPFPFDKGGDRPEAGTSAPSSDAETKPLSRATSISGHLSFARRTITVGQEAA